MATITIKIESEELAREVLTQMGYLPCDDIPDLVSVDDEPEGPPAVKEPEAPKEPVVREPRFAPKTESSRDVFAKDQIKKVLVSNGLLPPVEEEVWCPEPNDEGFGTPLEQSEDQEIKIKSMDMLQHVQYMEFMADREGDPNIIEREKQADAKRKLEKKEETQKNFCAAAATMKERLTHGQYLQFLEAHETDPNIDPDIKQIAYQLIMHDKAKANLEATIEAASKDEGYRNYIENVEPVSYEDYLKMMAA
jgi:hypothetical protein